MTDPAVPPRHTPLRATHEALGASFTDFGGWLMPVRYTSDLAEHHAVRTAAGIFDISHMAEFLVEGREARGLPRLRPALPGASRRCPCGRPSTASCSSDRAGSSTTSSSTALAGRALLRRRQRRQPRPGRASPRRARLGLRGDGRRRERRLRADRRAGPDRPRRARGDPGHPRDLGCGPLDELPYYAATDAFFDGSAARRPHRLHRARTASSCTSPRPMRVALWDALLRRRIAARPRARRARRARHAATGGRDAALRPRAVPRASSPPRPASAGSSPSDKKPSSSGAAALARGTGRRRPGARRARLGGQARRPCRLRRLPRRRARGRDHERRAQPDPAASDRHGLRRARPRPPRAPP